MQLGYVGLGKMGLNMTKRLLRKDYAVVSYDKDKSALVEATREGSLVAESTENLVSMLNEPRCIWLMVPDQNVDSALEPLYKNLSPGDTIIEGGNSFYLDSIRRAKAFSEKGINFLDVGVSGGPNSALNGSALFIGGDLGAFLKYENLFKDLAKDDSCFYAGRSGAGHFYKMIHNGIEYGMMQAIADGFSIIYASDFENNIEQVTKAFNGGIIESKLIRDVGKAFKEFGPHLKGVSGAVDSKGTGEWVVKTAKELGVEVPAIEAAVQFRRKSQKESSHSGRILTALRYVFGGHSI